MAVVVSSLSDSGAGTLRQAITDINAATATSPITFSVTGTITLASALPAINKNLTITGPGLSSLTISGNNLYQIFYLNLGFTISISGLTISSGRNTTGTTAGAGIYNNQANLTVDSCYFTNCYAGTGSAIYSVGGVSTTTVTNTSFVSNTATASFGAGIYAAGGTFIIGNCTFSNNTGNGYATNNAATTIYNCTFNGNTSGNAAAIYMANSGSSTILSSTISGNTSTGSAGGVYLGEYCSLTLKNSIISGNTGVSYNDFRSYSNATIPISKVANIVGSAQGWVADVATSVTLSALASNGGTTQTMAVSAGSVAIGAGNAAASNASPVSGLDQRGTTRSSTAPTIGAYEYVATTPTFNFPTSPSTGQVYTFNGIIWVWNGIGWKKRLILPSQDIFMSGNYGGL